MKYFVVIGPDDLVTSAGRATEVPTGAEEVPDYQGTVSALGRMMRVGGELVDRPRSPGVTTQGTEHTISNMPLGTVVTVFDALGGEQLGTVTAATEGASETINLPDPGTYEITVAAPAPALQTIQRVTTP